MPWTRIDVHSNILWLSLSSTVLLAALLAVKPDAISLPISRAFEGLTSSHSLQTTLSSNVSGPDTTAIILNWSRLPNVIRIVSILCDTQLEDTIAEIVVWNNNPKKLEQRDISSSGCPATKLRIFNSPKNLYFQARFIACAEASTQYCFIQDDDYIVYPEIIQTLRARITDPRRVSTTGIHLLPPHEHLSSSLRVLSTPSHIHTSFAWLGHGALILRPQVIAFLTLMSPLCLNVSEDDMKMADNFYTVLSNTVQEIWFDQGLELSGGEPFTAGSEGLERNRKFIMRAGEYLDSLMSNENLPSGKLPFVNTEPHIPPLDSISRAPCLKSICLLETTIKLLPQNIVHSAESAMNMLALEELNFNLLGAARRSHYLKYPPSNAVDGLLDTAFRSPAHARSGDSISIDVLSNISGEWSNIEFVWFVDSDTENILGAAIFETSQDGIHWMPSGNSVSCSETYISAVASTGRETQVTVFRECIVIFTPGGHSADLNSNLRLFRARLEEAREEKWCIYEVAIRGVK